jgi:hypothetical protein
MHTESKQHDLLPKDNSEETAVTILTRNKLVASIGLWLANISLISNNEFIYVR